MRSYNPDFDKNFSSEEERNLLLLDKEEKYTVININPDIITTYFLSKRIDELTEDSYVRQLMLCPYPEKILETLCEDLIPITAKFVAGSYKMGERGYESEEKALYECAKNYTNLKKLIYPGEFCSNTLLARINKWKFFESDYLKKKKDYLNDVIALDFLCDITNRSIVDSAIYNTIKDKLHKLLQVTLSVYGIYVDCAYPQANEGKDPMNHMELLKNFGSRFNLLTLECIERELTKTNIKDVPPHSRIESVPDLGFKLIKDDKTPRPGNHLVIKNVDFSTKLGNIIFYNIISNNFRFYRSVYFINCKFAGRNMNGCGTVNYDTTFINCEFNDKIKLANKFLKNIEFDNCLFTGTFDLSNSVYTGNTCWIHNSVFEKGSKLYFDEIKSEGKTESLIKFGDNLVKGEFFCREIGKKYNLNFDFIDTAFLGDFDFSKSFFGKKSHFSNIAFGKNLTLQREGFANAMKNSGFEEEANEAEISVQNIKRKQSGKLDMDAYQTAYATGFLNPDFAAFLLNKSTSYLAKKRAKDKITYTRDSLPFIISGRDIQYPVEALLALKSHNWARLKELRQKYPISKDSD